MFYLVGNMKIKTVYGPSAYKKGYSEGIRIMKAKEAKQWLDNENEEVCVVITSKEYNYLKQNLKKLV